MCATLCGLHSQMSAPEQGHWAREMVELIKFIENWYELDIIIVGHIKPSLQGIQIMDYFRTGRMCFRSGFMNAVYSKYRSPT